MDNGFCFHAKYIYLKLLLDIAWESRRGSWARMARMRLLKRFRRKLKIGPNATDFFTSAQKAPHSCRSSSRTPTILPKKNADLKYNHMEYGFMDRCKFIFWQGLWMDGFWVRTKKQRGVIKKNSSGPLENSTEKKAPSSSLSRQINNTI